MHGGPRDVAAALLEIVKGDELAGEEAEVAGTCAAQGAEVRAAAELLADIVRISADVKALAAHDAEVHFGQLDARDLTVKDAHETRFALHLLALARQLVEGHAVDLDGGHHRRRLVEVSAERIKRSGDLVLRELRNRFLFDDLALAVLAVGGDAERQRADVFLLLGHEQVLNLGGIPDHENEHARGHGIQRATVADLFRIQAASRDCHDVVRGHVLTFVHEENSVDVSFAHSGFGVGGRGHEVFSDQWSVVSVQEARLGAVISCSASARH